jgi:TonB family protein
MRLSALAMLFACATAAVAAEPTRTAAPPQQLPYAYIAFKPDTSDYYPADSRALGEQGTVSLVLCYDRDGKPADVSVVNSSGIDKIDEAAVRWGKAVRISPAIRNGASKADCVWVPAKFSLERVQEPPDQVEGSIPTPAIIWPSLPPPPWPGRFIPLEGEAR